VLQITPYKERKEKEKDPECSLVEEGIPSQIGICIEPTTLCVSLRSKAGTWTLLRDIVVSGGSRKNSQNNGSSAANQSQSAKPRVSTTHNKMAGIDNMLRMREF
jgi:hypothetical protein